MCTCVIFIHVHQYYLCLLVNTKPSKQKILDHVVPYVIPQWHDLGVKLLKEDQESQLDVIKSDHFGDNKRCCKEMFWYWLSISTNANWQQLIDALRSQAVELPVVADKLEKTLAGIDSSLFISIPHQ